MIVSSSGQNYKQNHHERRRGISAIPINLREFINEEQRGTLKQLEGFGWQLAFVRRPLFQDCTVIIRNADNTSFSVLEVDGTINAEPDIVIRH